MSSVQLPPDSTGKRVDTRALTEGADEVHRQVVVLGDPTDPAKVVSLSASSALLIGTTQDRFVDEFASFDTVNNWNLIQTGPGMTITTAGATGGARYLNIASGVNTDSETIIQSRFFFRSPVRMHGGVTASQRIANQELHVEFVEVDANGNLITDTTIATSPRFNNARNGFGVFFDGTGTSTIGCKIRAMGISELVTQPNNYTSTVATGTAPDFVPNAQFELHFMSDQATQMVRALNSNSLGSTGMNRNDYIPDVTKLYALRVRVRNLSTAPASSTDWRLHFVRIIDSTRVSVDFTQIGGNTMAQIAPGVNVLNTPTIPTIQNNSIFQDTTTNLAANATFNGTARDTSSAATNPFRNFVGRITCDQAGTFFLEDSSDAVTWSVMATAPVVANVPLFLTAPITRRQQRVRYVNGPTATTSILISCGMMRS